MSQDDVPVPRQPPRFVPTLTEVVPTHGATRAPEAAPVAQPLPPPAAVDVLELRTAEILARLGPDLDVRISEAIARVLHEQMLGLNARVQRAVADVVRDALSRVVVHGGDTPTGGNP